MEENLLQEKVASPPGLAKLALVKDLEPIKEDINEIKENIGGGNSALSERVTIIENSLGQLNGVVEELQDDVIQLDRMTIPDLIEEVDNVKKSVSDGKTKVAAAITGKGIETAATDTFDIMASNIQNIQTGSDTEDGDITSEDIITGKIGYAKGERIVGSMPVIEGSTFGLPINGTYNIPKGYHDGTGKVNQNITNNGAVNYSLPINGSYTIPEGYHNGQGKINQSIDVIAGETHTLALNGTYTIPAGVHDGTGKVTQNITNRGAVNATLAINGTYTIPAGYHNGNGKVTQSITTKSAEVFIPSTYNQTISSGRYLSGTQTILGDSNLISENIKNGVTIFNIRGTYSGTGGFSPTIGQNATFVRNITFSSNSTGYTIPYNGKIIAYSFEFRGTGSLPNMYCAAAPGLGWIQNITVFLVQDFYNINFAAKQDYVPYYLPNISITNSGKTFNISWPYGGSSNVSSIYLDYMYI